METKPMMKCGHAANGIDGLNNPVCVICIGLNPGANVIDTGPPSLEGRTARCGCGKTEPSSTKLAFFSQGRYYDSFYCGCRGWD